MFKDTWQHKTNPLHVYCRLRELGISKNNTKKIVTCYEKMKNRTLNKNKSRAMHDKTIDEVVEWFENKKYVKQINTNVEYVRGEIDIELVFYKPYIAHIEIKSNHTKKGFAYAKNQTCRSAKYFGVQDTILQFYYAGNQKKLTYLGKNGQLKHK